MVQARRISQGLVMLILLVVKRSRKLAWMHMISPFTFRTFTVCHVGGLGWIGLRLAGFDVIGFNFIGLMQVFEE